MHRFELTSAGLFMSINPAPTNPQFAMGPQKWVVFSPVGEDQNACNLLESPALCLIALMIKFRELSAEQKLLKIPCVGSRLALMIMI